MESKGANEKGGDENLALFGETKKVEVKNPTKVRQRVRSHSHN
jgi:hypothetical protein